MSTASGGIGHHSDANPNRNINSSESIAPTNSNIIANRSKTEPKAPRPQTTMEITSKSGTYPLPANVNFVPGGIQYSNAKVVDDKNMGVGAGGDCCSSCTMAHLNKWTFINKGAIIRRALEADVTLRKYALKFAESNNTTPPGHRLPSLSHLANSALVNPLTSVPPSSAAQWAEQMILEYMDGRYEKRFNEHSSDPETKFDIPSDTQHLSNASTHDPNASKLLEDAISAAWAQEKINTGRTRSDSVSNSPSKFPKVASPNEKDDDENARPPSLSSLLKSLHQLQQGYDPNANTKQSSHGHATGEPCGYVFRRGDIAWNCRTCQTDATCVLCEACFRESDHEGHEVFFHRTTPGGCCDCGDVEAWDVKGMCWKHRPIEEKQGEEDEEEGGMNDADTNVADEDNEVIDDDFEAVRAAKKSRLEQIRHVEGTPSPHPNATLEPQPFPPRLAAALGVIIGSIIQSVYTAAEGSAAGADVSQWRLKWADEICNLWNGVSDDEEYYRRASVLKAQLETRTAATANVPMWTLPQQVLDAHNEHYVEKLPKNHKLLLRLHNDDVHTFDEVIGALRSATPSSTPTVPMGGLGSIGQIGGSGMSASEMLAIAFSTSATVDSDSNMMATTPPPPPSNEATSSPRRVRTYDSDVTQPPERRFRGENSPSFQNSMHQFVADVDIPDPPTAPLVFSFDAAEELTRRVDAEGQVLVREYETLNGAGVGFSRLREPGLLCSVVTTARVDAEERAKVLLEWLSGLLSDHPVVRAIVVQALVDVTDGEDVLCSQDKENDGTSQGVAVWSNPRILPSWSGTNELWWNADINDKSNIPAWRKRLDAFPPHLESSYLTRQEGRELFLRGMMGKFADQFVSVTGADPDFYAHVPYSLPDSRLCKSPHALWGTLSLPHIVKARGGEEQNEFTHPVLRKLNDTSKATSAFGSKSEANIDTTVVLRSPVFVVDTDLRKHQESETLTSSLYPHRKCAGLSVVSGVSQVDGNGSLTYRYGNSSMGVTTKGNTEQVASCSSFVAPISPLLLILLLDPYSPKNIRSNLHRLFLSLLTNPRFKSRFAASLGAVVYRPTSNLFCAGIGTEADTLLGFTVQLFTTGSLVKALGNLEATKTLLCREDKVDVAEISCVSTLPIAHSVVRSIHTNILGATKEVSSLVSRANRNNGEDAASSANLTISEHPLNTRLPAAPDDKFIDSRCMKHKRLPLLLRDLEYIFETPGTAVKLLKSTRASNNTQTSAGIDVMNDSVTPSPSFVSPSVTPNNNAAFPNAIDFPIIWARLLRLGQGIDSQKRRISGGHIEFEEDRWLHAYGLSLNLSGTGDALAESPFSSSSYNGPEQSLSLLTSSTRSTNKEAMGSLFAAFFREIKMWLYREGLLESSSSRIRDSTGLEALQRSTLHVSASQLDASSIERMVEATGAIVSHSCDIACEKGVKNLPEAKLALLEAALLHERTKMSSLSDGSCSHGPVMGDWVKVPHSPLAGDCFSFHLPLHRAFARSILCFCSAIVPAEERSQNPNNWWRLPLLDDDDEFASDDNTKEGIMFKQDSLSALVRSTHKSSNFRVVWTSGPECSTPEAQLRKSRSRLMSSLLASTKVVHSLCDHPLRCIAASQQIDHHMWAKNGASTAGMALNYGSIPLCRSLRDLDLTLVQMSACGFNVGLGARRVFSLLTNRFSLESYLCDPDRKNSFGRVGWVKPPRMQEPEHPELLAESFFTTVCVLVSDLPPPPPTSLDDNSVLRRNLRRELLHALAVEPRSHSEAMQAASAAVSRRDETEGNIGSSGAASSVRTVFAEVLQSIGQQRKQGSRSAPRTYELKAEASDEYDPSFYHLRQTEHQHAMDNIARLRKQKAGATSSKTVVLPLVSEPPQGHPRFLACRLLIHLPSMFAAARRYLMYALFSGSWLPPSKPEPNIIANIEVLGDAAMDISGPQNRAYSRAASSMSNVSAMTNNAKPFSPETVASSSKSFLEVLHILTLQVHTLEECSGLHKQLPFLDHEQKALSSGISIDSYLKQLLYVPKTLINVWALQCAPDGPLPSDGSGENRGSVLGLLIALYEHRDNAKGANGGQKSGNDDHGGARALSSDGLKWLLRFFSALVDGAGGIKDARESATSGVLIESSLSGQLCKDPQTRNKIQRMLANLPDLWPGTNDDSSTDAASSSGVKEKMKESQKAAQARAMARMKKLQSKFAESMSSQFNDESEKKLVDDDEENLCIICKCDDADGDNGPMGYLGHVQRSRVAQLSSKSTLGQTAESGSDDLNNFYRVVGSKGCQLRSTESMGSAPVAFLPLGSIVEVLQSKVSPQLGLLSRRVYVRHVTEDQGGNEAAQGWASIQSWHGYNILSPLKSLCYTNTRWGPTRPIILQCGHSAHLKCVQSHCLSLHQRAAANQPYDGRFSANIEDGEFLCPLCKQLSNIVIPEERCIEVDPTVPPSPTSPPKEDEDDIDVMKDATTIRWKEIFQKVPVSYPDKDEATQSFGSNLLQAMQLPKPRLREREYWHPALRNWDFDDTESGTNPLIGSVLRFMRQLLVSWSATGHSAAAVEASSRGVREVVFGEVTYGITEPWSGYDSKSRDSHPMLLELKRTLAATSSLFGLVSYEMKNQLGNSAEKASGQAVHIIENLIGDILGGEHWTVTATSTHERHEWSAATSIVSSMMCHVSKGDTVALSREARAVAAAMWTITGSERQVSEGSTSSMDVDDPSPEVAVNDDGNVGNRNHESEAVTSRNSSRSTSQPRPVLPPKPLALHRAERNLKLELEADWGNLDPFKIESGQKKTPFRPAVASAFLYVPLLGWDLNTLTGAVFSSLLSTSSSAGMEELLQAARILYVGRLAQVLSTPSGFLLGNSVPEEEYDDFDDEPGWDNAKKKNESASIQKLLTFCRDSLPGKIEPNCSDMDNESILLQVGNAILPFGRTLVLLLRASASTLRQRQRRGRGESNAFETMTKVLESGQTMKIDDGFQLMEIIGAPLPSSILKSDSTSSWTSLITRWITALVGFEAYHGTRGCGLVFDKRKKTWIASAERDAPGKVSSMQNIQVEPSASAVEVAQLPPQGDEMNDDEPDEDVLGEEDSVDFSVDASDDDEDVAEDEGMEFEAGFGDDALLSDESDAADMEVDDAFAPVFARTNNRRALNALSSYLLSDPDVELMNDDLSDVNATLTESDGSKISGANDRMFAHVSRAAILPYQPSILGLSKVGPGPRGQRGEQFEYKIASNVMKDLSHLGMVHMSGSPPSCLVKLPKSFVELYSIVNKVKGRESNSDDADDGYETAVCLLTGAVMRSGSKSKRDRETNGACTVYARKTGSGIGVFFLIQKCTVLLMHNNKSAYSPSLYVDEHGEEDVGLRRGRPLYFSEERYQALETLWRTHGIPREVSQIRSTSDRVIRDNWY